ncbi:putative alpha-mannosyltransferase [Penicillium oxalicum 114-2]|uniref:Putative alpha-mannosyltransferase n=1 Tax=Penicillium oxalicum (strain 114-2 / CGMCC 5302) TaxID=933388 RepID=S8ARL3_PENO1|nr:putative alpha-mannosyltransferase [Penicillium oxalicum 114-2]
MIPRQYLRLRFLLFAVLLVSIIVWSVSNWRARSLDYSNHDNSSRLVNPVLDLQEAHRKFWHTFYELLETHGPQAMPIIEYEKAPTEGFDPNDSRPLKNYLTAVDSEDLSAIKTAHAGFVAAITGAEGTLSLPYRPDTRGIVSTAGGAYLPVLVISLRMLRRTGSTLPMEVFLADEDEYEAHICDVVLPSLNAQCVVLSRILASAPAEIAKYQFKPFAMLFSSFQDILFLDADAFPLINPEVLFETDPFRSMGLVTWPDFWASSISPLFYEIIDLPPPRLNLRASTESGELLLSKKTHARTLLLVTYYNYWGPEYYYPLLSQGAAGEGDKETFLAAATVTQQPFYQVSERLVALGHPKSKQTGGFAGSAMGQFNPIDDYQLVQRGISRLHGDAATPPDLFFIHANFPKFNPATVFDPHEVNPAFTDEGEYTRAWTLPEDVVGRYSAQEDVERAFWSQVRWTACELEDKFVSWQGHVGICDRVMKYWQSVFLSL